MSDSEDSEKHYKESTSRVNTKPRRQPDMKSEPSDEPTYSMTTVNIKIPPFWPEKPAIWFAQVECQFAISKVTDETAKFYHIVGSLERQYAAEVEDILTGAPDYNKLKSELIKRLSVSRENKVKQLLMVEELGNRKPSQFLRHLQHLAGPEVPGDFLKTIWTSRLPSGMQTIIASQPTLSLDALAELADRINDIAPSTHRVAEVSSSTSAFDELTKQVAVLTKQVHALTTKLDSRSRSRQRSTSHRDNRRSTSSRRSSSNYQKFPVCWYHNKFGAKATKCVKPCDFDSGKASGSQ